jgi:hypothetical protein
MVKLSEQLIKNNVDFNKALKRLTIVKMALSNFNISPHCTASSKTRARRKQLSGSISICMEYPWKNDLKIAEGGTHTTTGDYPFDIATVPATLKGGSTRKVKRSKNRYTRKSHKT